jgi:hypothetical protein
VLIECGIPNSGHWLLPGARLSGVDVSRRSTKSASIKEIAAFVADR